MKANQMTRAAPVLCLFIFVFSTSAWADRPAQPDVLTNPAVNEPLQADVSAPLRDMATPPPADAPRRVIPIRRPKLQQMMNAAAVRSQAASGDGALQTAILSTVLAIPGVNVLGVGNGFGSYKVVAAPSDANLAVGDTQVVQWVNVAYAVLDKKTGTPLAGPFDGNNFWKGFGGVCETANQGDPIIQFDKLAHRWVASQGLFNVRVTCIAVSTTPDALGTYYRFAYGQDGVPDYPKFGIQPNAYFQSINNFGTDASAYVGATVCAYDRNAMLAGRKSAKQVCFTTPTTFDDSLLPADLDSADVLPPTGQPEVFLGSIDNAPNGNVIYKYLFNVDFARPRNATFTGAGGTMAIPVANFQLACGGGSACIPQPDIDDTLGSLGDRLMYRLAYRNFGDHQSWVVSHSVNTTPAGPVGERWYEFRAPQNSTNLAVFQQGTYAPDSDNRWMGSIAMDKAGNIALGYSVSSKSTYPSIRYTARTLADPPGTMETESPLVNGTGSQVGTQSRWGDYTSMAIDADGCTFWYTNQYYGYPVSDKTSSYYGKITAPFNWSTQIASIRFPGCQ
jgi:hypothetical protein